MTIKYRVVEFEPHRYRVEFYNEMSGWQNALSGKIFDDAEDAIEVAKEQEYKHNFTTKTIWQSGTGTHLEETQRAAEIMNLIKPIPNHAIPWHHKE